MVVFVGIFPAINKLLEGFQELSRDHCPKVLDKISLESLSSKNKAVVHELSKESRLILPRPKFNPLSTQIHLPSNQISQTLPLHSSNLAEKQ